MASVEIPNLRLPSALAEMLGNLAAYRADSSSYDEDNLKPTPFAFERTIGLLTGVAQYTPARFPKGTVYPDGDGGIRVEWIYPAYEVKLIIRALESDRHYIFYKHEKEYGGSYEVTVETLDYYLNELIKHDQPTEC